MQTSFREIAIPLAIKGIPQIRLKPKSKVPLEKAWQTLATVDIDKIIAQDAETPGCGAASVAKSDGLCFFESDVEGTKERFEQETGETFKTFTVQSRPGRHHYYFFNTDASRTCGSITQQEIPFGSFRQNNQYVVSPGSIHQETGLPYEVVDNSSIIPIPAKLIEWLQSQIVKAPASQTSAASTKGPIPKGQHDVTLTAIAGKLRADGLEYDEMLPVLVREAERCVGRGDDWMEMVKKIVKSVCRYPAGDAGPTTLIAGRLPGQNVTAIVGTPKQEEVKPDPANWRDYYRSFGQLEDGDVRMILNGFMPEGINLIGGLAGQGKTLFALSLVKSLTTGEPFLGRFMTEDITPILYLIPESSSRAFKMRCKAFGIPDDEDVFLCRTISEGKPPTLDDPMLIEAVKHLKPVVILDTLPRFNESGDENDASGNKKLVNDLSNLRAHGAVAIIALHHATKSSADSEPTLENVLRGTGDIGAMADSVYSIRRDRNLYDDGKGPNEIEVRCVKPRDFEPPAPFKIAASYRKEDGTIASYIDEVGDFHLVETAAVIESEDRAFIKAINDEPTIPAEHLAEELGISNRKLRRLQRRLGYVKTLGRFGKWIPKVQLTNPDPAVLDPTYAESKAREEKLQKRDEVFELK
jgi:hypothetical protein